MPGCSQDNKAAQCIVFCAQGLGEAALNGFNMLSGDDRTVSVPAVLLLDVPQKDWKEQATVAEHRIVLTMPITMKDLRSKLAAADGSIAGGNTARNHEIHEKGRTSSFSCVSCISWFRCGWLESSQAVSRHAIIAAIRPVRSAESTLCQEPAMLTRLACFLSVVTLLSVCFLPSAQAADLDPAALSGDKAPQGAIWLESLDLSKIEQGWGQPQKGRSVDDNPLKIHGQEFRHGVGTHAVSEMHINLHGAVRSSSSPWSAWMTKRSQGTVTFEVSVDGKKRRERADAMGQTRRSAAGRSARRQTPVAAGRRLRRRHRLRPRRLGRRRAGAGTGLGNVRKPRRRPNARRSPSGYRPGKSRRAGHPRPADRRQHAGPAISVSHSGHGRETAQLRRQESAGRPHARSRDRHHQRLTAVEFVGSSVKNGTITFAGKQIPDCSTVVELEVKNARGECQTQV